MRTWRGASLVMAVLLLADCRARPATFAHSAADVIGTYRLRRDGEIRGHAWTVRSELTLVAPDAYYLDHLITHDGEDEEESETGKFRVDGDVLLLRSRKDETTDLRIRGDSLVAKLDWPGRWFAGRVGGAPVFVKVVQR